MKYTKQLGAAERKRLADSIREHRKWAFKRPTLTYNIFRSLKEVNSILGLNLPALIQKRIGNLPRNKVLRFLDSGSGALMVSADLKRIFKTRINITAISLVHPKVSLSTKKRVLKEIRQDFEETWSSQKKYELEQVIMTILKQETLKRKLKTHSKLLAEAKKNVALVDDLHVGLIENFRTKKKFDIIFDYSGPLNGGYHTAQAFRVYSQLLARGGNYYSVLNPHRIKIRCR